MDRKIFTLGFFVATMFIIRVVSGIDHAIFIGVIYLMFLEVVND